MQAYALKDFQISGKKILAGEIVPEVDLIQGHTLAQCGWICFGQPPDWLALQALERRDKLEAKSRKVR